MIIFIFKIIMTAVVIHLWIIPSLRKIVSIGKWLGEGWKPRREVYIFLLGYTVVIFLSLISIVAMWLNTQ